MWSQLEPNLAIVCACVPLLRPIFGTFFASHLSWHRSGSTGKSNSKQDDSIRMQTWTDVEAESRKGNKPSSYGAGVPVAQEQDYSPHYTVMGAPGLGKRTESEQALGGGRGFQMKMYDTGGFAGQEKATRQYYGSR
ncbi:hypothetical protein MMC21_002548 [Puttea exsequens]|nr:hypothetical protein [Puttea exsequens]